MLQKCPYCDQLIFYREKGHAKEDRCDLRKKAIPPPELTEPSWGDKPVSDWDTTYPQKESIQ